MDTGSNLILALAGLSIFSVLMYSLCQVVSAVKYYEKLDKNKGSKPK